jgi:hypothetical protein
MGRNVDEPLPETARTQTDAATKESETAGAAV